MNVASFAISNDHTVSSSSCMHNTKKCIYRQGTLYSIYYCYLIRLNINELILLFLLILVVSSVIMEIIIGGHAAACTKEPRENHTGTQNYLYVKYYPPAPKYGIYIRYTKGKAKLGRHTRIRTLYTFIDACIPAFFFGY